MLLWLVFNISVLIILQGFFLVVLTYMWLLFQLTKRFTAIKKRYKNIMLMIKSSFNVAYTLAELGKFSRLKNWKQSQSMSFSQVKTQVFWSFEASSGFWVMSRKIFCLVRCTLPLSRHFHSYDFFEEVPHQLRFPPSADVVAKNGLVRSFRCPWYPQSN